MNIDTLTIFVVAATLVMGVGGVLSAYFSAKTTERKIVEIRKLTELARHEQIHADEKFRYSAKEPVNLAAPDVVFIRVRRHRIVTKRAPFGVIPRAPRPEKLVRSH